LKSKSLSNRYAIAVQLLTNYKVIAQSHCNCIASPSQSLCNRIALHRIASHHDRDRFAIAIVPHHDCNRIAIASQSHRNRIASQSQSLRNRFAIASQLLRITIAIAL
jgi:hypothetical protein